MRSSYGYSILFVALLLASPVGAAQVAPAPESTAAGSDTNMTTALGNPFLLPAGWSATVEGPATMLTPPEEGSRIALVDVRAENADAALAAAWQAVGGNARELKIASDLPDVDGWSKRRRYEYITSPNEHRGVMAGTLFAGDAWTVWIYDMSIAVGEKRSSQVGQIFDRLLPKGYSRESFSGRKANRLDESRIAELTKFIEEGMAATRVPGVSLGIVQDGRVVFADGFGVRELGEPERPDGNTLYMVASNTKALTTLLIAKLVDAGKIGWKDPVVSLMPAFRLGDKDTTSKVLVEHLICACTGLPRQDMEWLFEYGNLTPEGAMDTLGTMQPTSEFGELFQYSNPMAAAAGYMAGSLLHPEHTLGEAYDLAMQDLVFDPLRMRATTFDYARAMSSGNFSNAHSTDIYGQPALAVFNLNYSAIPVRPAGAAWSNVNDMLRYVSMELAKGLLPDGERYISAGPLLERRRAMVALGDDAAYGMGLIVDTSYDVTVVHHGGDMIGFHSDMMWLPDHGVGAVVLTNGDPGWRIRSRFRRKLLEVLFDGKPEADEALAADAARYFEQLDAERSLLVAPADGEKSGKLAAAYENASLGRIDVRRQGKSTMFEFGEWESEVASRVNADGSLSFLTISPGVAGFEFVSNDSSTTLTLRDGQHEYAFDAL